MFDRLAKYLGMKSTPTFRFVVSAGVTAFALLVIYMGFSLMEPTPEPTELPKACSSEGLVTRCYTLSQNDCAMVWNRFENDCTGEVKRKYQGQATSILTGPLVKKCTFKKLDHSFRSQRKTPEDSNCQSHFSSLDSLSAN